MACSASAGPEMADDEAPDCITRDVSAFDGAICSCSCVRSRGNR